MATLEVQTFRIIGIGIRTSERIENSIKQRIPNLWQRFLDERFYEKIPNRIEPDKIYAVYSEYDGDEFTFVIGLKVAEFSTIPPGMIGKTVSTSKYHIIETSKPAPVDELSVQAWSQVKKSPSLHDKRQFDTDFEIYDINSESNKLALYIGTAG